ncbi:hypothetical protein E2C01_059774 [Portunus trituberculatus]|uniref:Uncharacterized protein n=1 Tax=Portunus trituberculatus TaxID=210409 RepID=A0A5B7H6R6_PORTR|nr:hypothetical protein [Portunus trituberculatus]
MSDSFREPHHHIVIHHEEREAAWCRVLRCSPCCLFPHPSLAAPTHGVTLGSESSSTPGTLKGETLFQVASSQSPRLRGCSHVHKNPSTASHRTAT